MDGHYSEGGQHLMLGIGSTEAANEAAQQARHAAEAAVPPAANAAGLVRSGATVYGAIVDDVERVVTGTKATFENLKGAAAAANPDIEILEELGAVTATPDWPERAASQFKYVADELGTGASDTEYGAIEDAGDATYATVLGKAGANAYRALTHYRTALDSADPDEVIPKAAAHHQSVEPAQGSASVAGSQAAQLAQRIGGVIKGVEEDSAGVAALRGRIAAFLTNLGNLVTEAEQIMGQAQELSDKVKERHAAIQGTVEDAAALPAKVEKARDDVTAVVQTGAAVLEAARITQGRMGGLQS